jgi:hypothetical protein
MQNFVLQFMHEVQLIEITINALDERPRRLPKYMIRGKMMSIFIRRVATTHLQIYYNIARLKSKG